VKRSGNVRLLFSASLLAGAAVGAALVSSCSKPAPARVADDGFDPERTYTDNTYYPRLGYYHSGAHWFYPHPVNYFVPGQGYFYGGSWYPVAQTLMLLSRPDSSRAYAYLAAHRRRDDGTGFWGYGGGGYHGGGSGGFYNGSGESGISRGGFGEAGHAFGGHGGGE